MVVASFQVVGVKPQWLRRPKPVVKFVLTSGRGRRTKECVPPLSCLCFGTRQRGVIASCVRGCLLGFVCGFIVKPPCRERLSVLCVGLSVHPRYYTGVCDPPTASNPSSTTTDSNSNNVFTWSDAGGWDVSLPFGVNHREAVELRAVVLHGSTVLTTGAVDVSALLRTCSPEALASAKAGPEAGAGAGAGAGGAEPSGTGAGGGPDGGHGEPSGQGGSAGQGGDEQPDPTAHPKLPIEEMVG